MVRFATYKELTSIRDLDTVLPDRDMFYAARDDKIFNKCAVVGNSGSLLESQHGAAIDENDVVFRFNAGITDGYEQFVGTKTTFRLLNNVDSAPKEPGEITISTIRTLDLKIWAHSIRLHPERLASAFSLDPEFLCHTWKWVGKRGHKPSSGLVGIVLAMRLCRKVTTYGFAFNNYFKKDSRPHYYDWERPAKGREKVHPFQREITLYNVLKDRGYIEMIE